MKVTSWSRCVWCASGFAMLLLAISIAPSLRPFWMESARSQVLRSVVGDGIAAAPLVRDILWFALIAVLLHLLLAGVAVLLTKATEVARISDPTQRLGTCFLWFVAFSTLLILQCAVEFPRSHAGGYYGSIAGFDLFGVHVSDIVGAVLAFFVVAVVALALARARARQLPSAVAAGFAVAAMVLVFVTLISHRSVASPAHESTRPHVIILGIDSLRSDLTQELTAAGNLPHVASLLERSAWFTDATTPLARTFPAWVSILTGRSPAASNIVCNLMPRDQVQAGQTLASELRSAGYRTVFATDEVRFSNIDTSYGFDQVEAPEIGAADFLIPQFSDIPLVNAITNWPVAESLLPQLYANRAVQFTYEPETFVARLRRSVRFDRPTFLAVHLTVSHWPYVSASTPIRANSGNTWDDNYLDYVDSVQRADAQIGEIIAWLEREGALKNAIVVLLSDHGEALARPNDSLLANVTEGEISKMLVARTGHGTSVLSSSQYQVVLGISAFGSVAARVTRGRRAFPASLEDVTPTLIDLLQVKSKSRYDGQSLVKVLLPDGDARSDQTRPRFTETGFNVPKVLKGRFDADQIAAQGAGHYQISPTSGYVQLRPESASYVRENKEFAVIMGDWILAALPSGNNAYRHILARRDGSQALLVNSIADHPALPSMWRALSQRFGVYVSAVTPVSPTIASLPHASSHPSTIGL